MITTTAGEAFTHLEQVDLARLVFKRFGNDFKIATAAWRRLLQNDCSETDFRDLVLYPEHTAHCEGQQCREDS